MRHESKSQKLIFQLQLFDRVLKTPQCCLCGKNKGLKYDLDSDTIIGSHSLFLRCFCVLDSQNLGVLLVLRFLLEKKRKKLTRIPSQTSSNNWEWVRDTQMATLFIAQTQTSFRHYKWPLHQNIWTSAHMSLSQGKGYSVKQSSEKQSDVVYKCCFFLIIRPVFSEPW